MREANYNLEENKDYNFVYSEEDPEAVVKLISGDYEGISVKFADVSMQENDDATEAYLNFSFDVVDANGSLFLEENEEFKNYLGDVLTSIIWNNIIKNDTNTVDKE